MIKACSSGLLKKPAFCQVNWDKLLYLLCLSTPSLSRKIRRNTQTVEGAVIGGATGAVGGSIAVSVGAGPEALAAGASGAVGGATAHVVGCWG